MRPTGCVGERVFSLVPLVDAEACDWVVQRLWKLRDCWIPRGVHKSGFATLGVCAYLDLAGSTDVTASYFQPALRLNALLTGNFGWLLDRLRQAVSNELDREVDFDDRLARPGFHIWPSTAIHRQANASLHFDLQYRHLPDHYQPVDESEVMSFTLPIRVPARGSGLRYWDLTLADYLREQRDGSALSLPDRVRDVPAQYLDYTAGTLVIHRELILHQIGATPVVGASDLRVTLQAHGIVDGTRLILYW